MKLTKPQIEMLRKYAKSCANVAENEELRETAERKLFEYFIENNDAGRAALAELEKQNV